MRDHVRLEAAAARTIVGLFAAGLLIAGCNASGTGATGTSSTSPPATTSATSSAAPQSGESAAPTTTSAAPQPVAAARPGRCHTAQLAGRIRMLDAAAGNRYAALVLTNTSSGSCRTYGYVGLQLTGAGGTTVPTTVVRETRPSPHGITLRPGQSAWTRIHWTVASGAGEPVTGPCEPQASRLLVIPPDERTQLTAGWPSGSVCEHGKIFVTALSPGMG